MTVISYAQDDPRVVLRLRKISKLFPGTTALDAVSMDIARGEVHALVGGNGSGKSTLIKILAGVLPADKGTLQIDKSAYDLTHFSPSLARRHDLHFVHQQPTTFADLTVAENLAIGRGFETAVFGTIRWRKVRQRVSDVLRRFGIEAEPNQLLGDLGPASRMMIAIARALQDHDGAREGVLVLDEPTAALSSGEEATVIAALRRYASAGQSILFVSHRLDEVLQVADRITVLRDGRRVDTFEREGLAHHDLVELIVGSPVDTYFPSLAVQGEARPMLEVADLRGGAVKHASLRLAAGEIVGVAGPAGSGRSTLLRLLFCAQKRDAGAIDIDGSRFVGSSPAAAMRAGIAFLPEGRKEALFMDFSVAENLSAARVSDYWRRGLMRHRAEEADASRSIVQFSIRGASPKAPITTLSGGNQQKVVLSRWLARGPRILLMDEPTQGVDVSARAELWRSIYDASAGGAATLVVSSDLDELTYVCQRVIVLREGRIVAEVSGPLLTIKHITHLLHGTHEAL